MKVKVIKKKKKRFNQRVNFLIYYKYIISSRRPNGALKAKRKEEPQENALLSYRALCTWVVGFKGLRIKTTKRTL